MGFNVSLRMLNLSSNKISKLEGLAHLKNLVFFDVSDNKIEEFDPDSELPKGLQIVRMNDNPVEQNDKKYREKLIVALDDLVELDRLQVIQAERLLYKGLLPKHLHPQVNNRLKQLRKEKMEQEAREKLEFEVQAEMMEDK